ncbi:sensor histidine kinase [Streptomyces sp. P38-E01]|uniref:Oxygen sensor histidine kinase NreB n=1 Tax=Streptomyces tardus TaxID=2780544 RepID=A0A949JLP9_9ACTN|nr:sensor histidine kinase [Streptomyces tardus]
MNAPHSAPAPAPAAASGPARRAPVPRALRGCLHLLVALLLALTAVRALTDASSTRADSWLVVLAAATTGGLYALGPLAGSRGGSAAAILWWPAAVTAAWLVLLACAQDGVWMAFPLFFLQLHLLAPRYALPAVAATTAAAVAGFGWHTHTLSVGTVVGPVLGAAVAVAFVFGYRALHHESEQRQRLIEELTATRGELAAAERAAGVSAERERLAREIHDTLAQGLSSIQLLLRAAERALPADPGAAAGHVQHARVTAVQNLTEARRFVHELSPPDLEGSSLTAALERLCVRADATGEPAVGFSTSGTPLPLATAAEAAVLRIAQSALGNALRHADARQVRMTLSWMPDPDRPEVVLDVVDDGRGFLPDALPRPGTSPDGGGFGVAAMRARARASGGDLVVESAPGAGTAVAATLPALGTRPTTPGRAPGGEGPGGQGSGDQTSGSQVSGSQVSGAPASGDRGPAEQQGAHRAGRGQRRRAEQARRVRRERREPQEGETSDG